MPDVRRRLAAVLLVSTFAGAPASASEPSTPLAAGQQELALQLGWGRGTTVGGGRGEVDQTSFVDVRPRWGIGLTDPLGGDAAWYRGNLELLVDGELLFNTRPRSGWAAGASLLVRWNFASHGRWTPFFEAGAGVLHLAFEIDEQRDGLNFTPQAGVGAHYMLSDRLALTGSWRFHHISNAGREQPNLGINSSLVQLGLTWFPR